MSNYIKILDAWLDAIRERTAPEDDEVALDLSVLNDDDLGALGAGLNDIYETAQAIVAKLAPLPQTDPSNDALDTVLIEIEIDVEHINYHWNDMVTRLRERGMFPDWNEDDEEGGSGIVR